MPWPAPTRGNVRAIRSTSMPPSMATALPRAPESDTRRASSTGTRHVATSRISSTLQRVRASKSSTWTQQPPRDSRVSPTSISDHPVLRERPSSWNPKVRGEPWWRGKAVPSFSQAADTTFGDITTPVTSSPNLGRGMSMSLCTSLPSTMFTTYTPRRVSCYAPITAMTPPSSWELCQEPRAPSCLRVKPRQNTPLMAETTTT
mmetsp:Transcript_3004/g.6662  ORF Transcript_3004/g.6662 Transcript_3004/m.6662 type:complete len:203 (+) Transcript_3004:465-1073(+)